MASDPEDIQVPGEGSARGRLRGPWWFQGRRDLTEEQRQSLLAQLYFDGAERLPFLRRFAALMAFAVLIAVFGLAGDSAPVVIGAMLVSPLTTPLLGVAAGLVMGWPRRVAESILILLVAALGGLALAWLALKLIPEPSALTAQSQELLARTEPRLLDLGVALVAGGAGAYVLVRQEAIGALPGVAIAVALVPPLATVGMMLELGEASRAGEALLLFLTNLAGIVLAAAVVMLATGTRPSHAEQHRGASARVGVGLAALVVILITVPLAAHTAERTRAALDEDDATEVVEDFLQDGVFEIQHVEIDDGLVDLDLAGPNRPPPLDELAAKLSQTLGQPVELSVDWTKVVRLKGAAAG